MLKFFKIGALILVLQMLSMPCTRADLSGLKQYLSDRSSMPRMYIPDVAVVGKEALITIVAKGASKVRLLGSFDANGIEGFDHDLKLRLGNEYHDWGVKEFDKGQNQVTFSVPFFDQESSGKNYYFEALVSYPGGYMDRIERAEIFGSNANFKSINGLAISPAPEKGSGVGYDVKNSLFPGFSQFGNRY